ncbi:putative nonessential protein required for the fusion of transport vesicles derived from the endocytic pathway with the Golgi complex [Lyophyllum shimeji]|uniref:Protein transport protein SFT2 n=1 Tax=Lyophyllum shimeji TaxID=47721 RepID=A0A9P3UJ01_LYOSH|nr:putative nonessential protein required for the fusion of transport vesicles derived from the endocytic pathway with the Golgi complex [Lyophyllum shimeji]
MTDVLSLDLPTCNISRELRTERCWHSSYPPRLSHRTFHPTSTIMANKGWFNLEAAGGAIPETQFFEGDSAFKFLGLSRTQRLYGFVGCLAIGFLLSILGSIVLFLGQLGIFAVLYTIGTIVSLVGTGFLLGFAKQLQLMFKPVRIVATILFLGSIGLVFVGAFVLRSDILCLIFVIIEYLAYTWYTLSYIPYARTAVLKAVGLG